LRNSGPNEKKITNASKETIGNVIAQLSTIDERFERLSALEDTTNEINADLAELKGIRAEVQSLKESVEGKNNKTESCGVSERAVASASD